MTHSRSTCGFSSTRLMAAALALASMTAVSMPAFAYEGHQNRRVEHGADRGGRSDHSDRGYRSERGDHHAAIDRGGYRHHESRRD